MKKAIYLLNSVILFLIIWFESNSGSDKTVIISSLVFVVLLALNLLLGVVAQIHGNPIYRHYYYSALGLVVGVVTVLSFFLLDM